MLLEILLKQGHPAEGHRRQLCDTCALGWVLRGLVHVHQPPDQPFLAHVLMGTQLPQQHGCTFGSVYTYIYMFSLQQQFRAGALVLREYPVCITLHNSRSVFRPASLTLCVDICMHTRVDGWTGTNTRCIQRVNLSPAITSSPLQEASPRTWAHREEGTRCWWHLDGAVPRWEGWSWPWGDQRDHLCLEVGDRERKLKVSVM